MPMPPGSLPSPTRLAERRKRVLGELGRSALVLCAGRPKVKSGDTTYRFRAASEFQYLVGWAEPGAVLVLRAHESANRCILFVPPRDPDLELWTGPRLGVERAVEALGADAACSTTDLDARLPELLTGAERVFFRLGEDRDMDRRVIGVLGHARSRAGRGGGTPSGVADPGLLLDEMRLVKDSEELTSIRRACQLTVNGFREAIPQVAPGKGEWELQGALEGALLRGGAFGPAFSTIVGSGPRAGVLHYTANNCVLPSAGWVLLDAGAELNGYSGDVTRSLPIQGSGTDAARSLYQAVDEARAAAVSAVRPGNTMDDVEAAARSRLEAALTDLKLWEGVTPAGRAKRFKRLAPHKVSHWLGLDVHDVGAYNPQGASRVLEPGMVMTIEPGLYIGEDDEAAPPDLRGIGIRVEDDVVVTEDGAENLTATLPTDLDELVALRDSGTQ